MQTSQSTSKAEEKRGVIFALGAYVAWGFFPIYWHLIRDVGPAEILSHRIIWSWIFYVILLRWRGFNFFGEVSRVSGREVKYLLVSAVLISANWLIYIFAVTRGHVLESSLGYFINPLVNVFLGFIVFRENLSKRRWTAIFLAFIGVASMVAVSSGSAWIPLSLAISFALYGLVRKLSSISALFGSALETLFLVPCALIYLFGFGSSTSSLMTSGHFGTMFYLVLGGAVTGLPLLWFVEAVNRIPYSLLAFLQFVSPTLQFLTAVYFFQENFGLGQAVTFGLIWMGVLIFLGDVVAKWRGP